MASDHVSADMVSGSEFPFLIQKYGVSSVPHTVINEEHSLVGTLSERELVNAIIKATA